MICITRYTGNYGCIACLLQTPVEAACAAGNNSPRPFGVRGHLLTSRPLITLSTTTPRKPSGYTDSPAGYPANPAGSSDDLARITDPTGRILGLMPHPERNVESWHRPGWTRGQGAGASGPAAGLRLFKDAVEHLRGARVTG